MSCCKLNFISICLAIRLSSYLSIYLSTSLSCTILMQSSLEKYTHGVVWQKPSVSVEDEPPVPPPLHDFAPLEHRAIEITRWRLRGEGSHESDSVDSVEDLFMITQRIIINLTRATQVQGILANQMLRFQNFSRFAAAARSARTRTLQLNKS